MSEYYALGTTARFVFASSTQSKQIQNCAGGSVYYSTLSTVSASVHDGVLGVGSALTITTPTYIASASTSEVLVQELGVEQDSIDAAVAAHEADVDAHSEANLERVFNVVALGATGDGITDDTAAVNAAISAAAALGGGTVLFPPGTYLIASALTVTANVHLVGQGKASVIDQTGSANTIEVTGDHASVRRLALRGNPAASATNVVVLDDCSDSEVRDCHISEARLWGVKLQGTTRCVISDNIFETAYVANTETNSADIYVGEGTTATDNRITGNRCLSTNKNCGILLQATGSAHTIQRTIVRENHVTGTIRNPSNTSGHGIILYSLTFANQTIQHNAIVGNTVVATENVGIYVDSGSAVSPIKDTLIAGNRLYGCLSVGSGSVTNDAVIAVDHGPRTIVANNHIVGGGSGAANQAAIGLNQLADDVLVIGNHGTSLGSLKNGLQILDNTNVCNRLRAIGNVFEDNGVGATIVIATGAGHVIKGNVLRGAGYRGIDLYENLATVSDVTVEGNVVIGTTNEAFGDGVTRSRWLNNRAISCASFRNTSGSTDGEWRGNRQSTGPIQGRAVLVGGTVTVTAAEVIASDNILLTRVVTGGTAGHLTVGTITAGTSFVIDSSSGTDTSTVYWEIVH